jgi:hypothetical protein
LGTIGTGAAARVIGFAAVATGRWVLRDATAGLGLAAGATVTAAGVTGRVAASGAGTPTGAADRAAAGAIMSRVATDGFGLATGAAVVAAGSLP